MPFGHRDQEPIFQAALGPAQVVTGDDALSLELLADALRVPAAHLDGELVEERCRSKAGRVARELRANRRGRGASMWYKVC